MRLSAARHRQIQPGFAKCENFDDNEALAGLVTENRCFATRWQRHKALDMPWLRQPVDQALDELFTVYSD
jgi:hypothetical protein